MLTGDFNKALKVSDVPVSMDVFLVLQPQIMPLLSYLNHVYIDYMICLAYAEGPILRS